MQTPHQPSLQHSHLDGMSHTSSHSQTPARIRIHTTSTSKVQRECGSSSTWRGRRGPLSSFAMKSGLSLSTPTTRLDSLTLPHPLNNLSKLIVAYSGSGMSLVVGISHVRLSPDQ